jgi:hypothetical protein
MFGQFAPSLDATQGKSAFFRTLIVPDIPYRAESLPLMIHSPVLSGLMPASAAAWRMTRSPSSALSAQT